MSTWSFTQPAPSRLVGEGGEGGREVTRERRRRQETVCLRGLPHDPHPCPSPTSLHSGARKRGPGGGGEAQFGAVEATPAGLPTTVTSIPLSRSRFATRLAPSSVTAPIMAERAVK